MNLTMPDFIKRMLGFVDKAEAHMKAEVELATARDRISTLEKELADLKAGSPDGEVAITVKSLQAELDKSKSDALEALAAKDKELTDFKAQAATDLLAAQNKANEVLASMGISSDQLPAAGTPSGNAAGKGQNPISDLRDQLAKATDPKEKYRLSMKIRELTSPKAKAA